MNAEDWQAAAEVLGVVLVLGNILGGALIYRMQASFVTRAEHERMAARMNAADERADDIDRRVAKLVTTDEMSTVYNRLGNVEQLAATMNGRLGGIADMLTSTNHMLNLLVQNELKGKP